MRLLLLACLLAPPAAAALHGGTETQQAVYRRLPEKVQAVDVEVRHRPGLEVRGRYYPWERRILLRHPKMLGTFLHELGHHAHAQVLTAEQWDEWRGIWRANRRKLPTTYARRSAPEGFAECFRVWQQRKPLKPEFQNWLEVTLGTMSLEGSR